MTFSEALAAIYTEAMVAAEMQGRFIKVDIIFTFDRRIFGALVDAPSGDIIGETELYSIAVDPPAPSGPFKPILIK